MRTDDVKPDYRLIAIDETRYYGFSPEDAGRIAQIFQCYIYDQHEYTYCCELTPSHYLEPVYTSIVFHETTPPEVHDELQDRYGNEPAEGIYMHVSAVQAYVAAHPTRVHVYGEAESMEDVREYYSGNCVL